QKRESRLPGSPGHLVLRHRRPGDPAPTRGICAISLRTFGPSSRTLARSTMVLTAAPPVRALGELAWFVLPRPDSAGGGSHFLIHRRDRGLGDVSPPGRGSAQNPPVVGRSIGGGAGCGCCLIGGSGRA